MTYRTSFMMAGGVVEKRELPESTLSELKVRVHVTTTFIQP